jgi:hypothetical protein
VEHQETAGLEVAFQIKVQHKKLVDADHLACVFDIEKIFIRPAEVNTCLSR